MNDIRNHQEINYLDRVARSEIKRILSKLGKDEKHFKNIFQKYKEIWDILHYNRIYKDPELLVPLIIFFYYRGQNKDVGDRYLIEISKINDIEFLSFVFQILEFTLEKEEYRPQFAYDKILENLGYMEEFIKFIGFLKSSEYCHDCGIISDKSRLIHFYFDNMLSV